MKRLPSATTLVPGSSPLETAIIPSCCVPMVMGRCANLPGSTWTYTMGSFLSSRSTDETLAILKKAHAENPRIKLVNFSRHFGKEAALTAGVDFAAGDAVVPIDADLQDPPELIPEMVAKWREGYDMVLATRSERKTDSFLKRTTAGIFYRTAGCLFDVPMPHNAGDFRLMDRRVVNALKTLPERTRFMKGLFAWLGFTSVSIPYERRPRAAGKTKFKPWKLWNFALDGICSFTTLPLRMWTYLGVFAAFLSLCYLVFIAMKTLILGVDVPGYASIICFLLFFNGMTLVGLGIIGEYLGRIFIEVKQRPLYLVESADGFDEQVPNRNG